MPSRNYNYLNNNIEIEDWHKLENVPNPSEINEIPTPSGDKATRFPTSIPSPFARIDLARMSFEYVQAEKNIDDNTIYHQMVSHCLDVAELFFNISDYPNAKIINWDRSVGLSRMRESISENQKLIGKTLELFFDQDKVANNFDEFHNMYILIINNKVVGATSPISLFFPNGDDLAAQNIKLGNRTAFTKGEERPLYSRNDAFQKYIYSLFLASEEKLVREMASFYKYLDLNLSVLSKTKPDLYKDIKGLDADNLFEGLERMKLNDNPIQVLGLPLYQKSSADEQGSIAKLSQLAVGSNYGGSTIMPLILQNGLQEPLIYTSQETRWDKSTHVPYVDHRALNDRTLPGTNIKYPYLTVSDFLQDELVELPYNLSKEFWNGTLTKNSSPEEREFHPFLLPLKPLLFDYFSFEQIKTFVHADGKPFYELKESNVYEAILRIPIKGNDLVKYITIKRKYEKYTDKSGLIIPATNKITDTNNIGNVHMIQSAIAILPTFKAPNYNHYRVMQVRNMNENHFTLQFKSFLNTSENILSEEVIRTTKSMNIGYSSMIYALSQFDFMLLENDNFKAMLIPEFIRHSGNSSIEFSIDFGTTNTHIEYVTGEHTSRSNDLSFDRTYITTLNSEAVHRTEWEYFDQELCPLSIGKGNKFYFPTRTALYSHHTDTRFTVAALGSTNIGFHYQKDKVKNGAHVYSDLKWSNATENELRLKAFFESLALLMFQKAIKESCSIENVKFNISYPASMNRKIRNGFEKAWNEVLEKYFKNPVVIPHLESIAPYFFYNYNSENGVDSETYPVVTIDIGGGTSDILVIYKSKVVALASARYAGETIFGDGMSGHPDNNGFVQKCWETFVNELNELQMGNEIQMLKGCRNINSIETCSAFFKLKELAKDKENATLDFAKEIQRHPSLENAIVFFHAALVYYIFHRMKQIGLPAPEDITYSGNASKTVHIIDKGILQDLVNKIGQHVFGDIDARLEIADSPKHVTAKGLFYSEDMTVNQEEQLLLRTNTNKDAVTDDHKQEVLQLHEEFIALMNKFNEEKFFKDEGIEMNMKQIENVYNRKTVLKSLNTVIGRYGEEINEPLFFMPLRAIINKIAAL